MLLLHFVIYYNTVGGRQHCLSNTATFSGVKAELYTLILEVLIFKNSIIISLITPEE